jgi:hypothetical protein
MSDYAEIVALVEGKTEQIFIRNILGPYLAERQIYMTPIVVSKPGQKGGDIKFSRVKNDIELHLKQRSNTFLTLFVDYYGMKSDWPGHVEAKQHPTSAGKARIINRRTKDRVNSLFANQNSDKRFIPYVAMYEFEAMLFSDPRILAEQLRIPQSRIEPVLEECNEPENIDDSPQTAPSKRLEHLSSRFKKTTTGIAVLNATGLAKTRARCPIFNKWLTDIESLKENGP